MQQILRARGWLLARGLSLQTLSTLTRSTLTTLHGGCALSEEVALVKTRNHTADAVSERVAAPVGVLHMAAHLQLACTPRQPCKGDTDCEN